jgi:pimeloyl-ACP methyl ester carboxylesterase
VLAFFQVMGGLAERSSATPAELRYGAAIFNAGERSSATPAELRYGAAIFNAGELQSMFAAVNGTRLYYEEAGAGPAVVLIHGFTLDTRMWDDQFPALAQRFRVIRYDLRGFGRSALPDGPYSHVEDLRALLDHLGIAQASLVGLSKGGGVALDFALTYPGRTTALALLDTILGGHAWSAEGSGRDALVWQEAARGGIPAARASWLAHPLFAPAMRRPAVAARLHAIIGDYSGWHFVNPNPEQDISPPAAARLQLPDGGRPVRPRRRDVQNQLSALDFHVLQWIHVAAGRLVPDLERTAAVLDAKPAGPLASGRLNVEVPPAQERARLGCHQGRGDQRGGDPAA